MKLICLLLSGFKYFSVAEHDSVLQKVMICFMQLFIPSDFPLFQAVSFMAYSVFLKVTKSLFSLESMQHGRQPPFWGSLLHLQNITQVQESRRDFESLWRAFSWLFAQHTPHNILFSLTEGTFCSLVAFTVCSKVYFKNKK